MLTLSRPHNLSPGDQSAANAMFLQLVVRHLVVRQRLRVCLEHGSHGFPQVLDGVEVLDQKVSTSSSKDSTTAHLQEGVEVACIAELIQTSREVWAYRRADIARYDVFSQD